MACEAGACGLPVIALSTHNIRAHIGNEPFFEYSGDLRKDLRYLLENDSKRMKVADKGRRYVQEHQGALNVAKRTSEVYRSIL